MAGRVADISKTPLLDTFCRSGRFAHLFLKLSGVYTLRRGLAGLVAGCGAAYLLSSPSSSTSFFPSPAAAAAAAASASAAAFFLEPKRGMGTAVLDRQSCRARAPGHDDGRQQARRFWTALPGGELARTSRVAPGETMGSRLTRPLLLLAAAAPPGPRACDARRRNPCVGAATTALEGGLLASCQRGPRTYYPTHGRILLGRLETPVVPWKCGALADLGVTWSIKRDDTSGLELSGNKVQARVPDGR